MKKGPLRVGFDLDGVILYNPARIARPIVAVIKRFLLKKKKLKFYVPQSKWERLMWHWFHKSSLFVASGFDEVRTLAKENVIEPYIITARYSFLKEDFEKWLNKMKTVEYIKKSIHNQFDDQPHLYKEKMVREHNLDVFIEDNLDIVKHLAATFPDKVIIWVYNIMDKNVDYPYKVPSLKEGIKMIKKIAAER